jgi:NitT/TauT family transport system ATP-binding protein
MKPESALLELHKVAKHYAGRDGGTIKVLEGIDLVVSPGEIVALVGRSGCGKSTLLRIVCGLTQASSGRVSYRGRAVTKPQPGISMVFQTFALFPWLNVLQNVELGLEAQGVPREARRSRALAVIDMIGLDGFESAYPKELSGGMRQRVGFARALVVNPDVLLMDEAFSSLDVPTAESLRNDLLELWLERQIPTRAIVMVSHDIEEALLMADRVIVLEANPGRVKAEIPVTLRHPRDRDAHAFRRLAEQVYATMTAAPGATAPTRALGIGYRLPSAAVGQMLGLLEKLNEPGAQGSAELAVLAEEMQWEVPELLPVLEGLELLDLARTAGQRVELTAHGKAFAEADILRRKEIFAAHLLRRVPLAAHLRRVLDERARARAPHSRFLRELEHFLTPGEAERVLEAITDWGRYAEIFAFDASTGTFSLDNPGAARKARTD